jgi:hypothetical protein
MLRRIKMRVRQPAFVLQADLLCLNNRGRRGIILVMARVLIKESLASRLLKVTP